MATAPKTDPGVELVRTDDAESLAMVLAGMGEVEVSSPEEAQATRFAMIAELLAAETEDELWRELPTWSSKDYVGAAFEIHDARAWRSKFADAGGFLSCPSVNLATGEQGILNTGAGRLAARIGWYKLHGKLPVKLEIVERSKTADGYSILDAKLV